MASCSSLLSSFMGDTLASTSLQPFSTVRLKLASLRGFECKPNHFLVVSKRRLSGLEEAMLINRAIEQGKVENPGKLRKRPPLRPGKVRPRLPVPDHIIRPPYVNSRSLPELGKEPQIHDAEGIECMRASCQLAARVLKYAGTLVKPSVTTDEIDKAVHKMIIDAGAYPSPLGYGGFPKSVCTSVNECLCHGIPDSRQLQHGDIINIDVTVYLNGYHGDTSKTFLCGDAGEEAKRLVKVTEECLYGAISVCKAGVGFKQIGKKINEHAAKYGYSVDRRFVGHGVGKIFHSEPVIFHFRNDKPGCMVAGQTFTIDINHGVIILSEVLICSVYYQIVARLLPRRKGACACLAGGPGEEHKIWLNTSLQKKGAAHTSKWHDCPRRCVEAVEL